MSKYIFYLFVFLANICICEKKLEWESIDGEWGNFEAKEIYEFLINEKIPIEKRLDFFGRYTIDCYFACYKQKDFDEEELQQFWLLCEPFYVRKIYDYTGVIIEKKKDLYRKWHQKHREDNRENIYEPDGSVQFWYTWVHDRLDRIEEDKKEISPENLRKYLFISTKIDHEAEERRRIMQEKIDKAERERNKGMHSFVKYLYQMLKAYPEEQHAVKYIKEYYDELRNPVKEPEPDRKPVDL